jgi:hypothetical protein
VERRALKDQKRLEVIEDITEVLRKNRINDAEQSKDPEAYTQDIRYAQLERMVASERRLLEEISLPCRLLLEHFTAFLDQPDRNIGVRYGSSEYSYAAYHGFVINEWCHVTLRLGNYWITWRDDEYEYMFYADKVILRSYDLQKPEICFSFNFSLKYSKLLDVFADVVNHPQTGYYQPDLFDQKIE